MTNLRETGEFNIIKGIRDILSNYTLPKADIPIGDDAAYYMGQLSCLDTLQEGVHFSLDYFSYFDIGYKALAVNLSDIAAMGGVPLYCLVGLGLPDNTTLENVEDIYKGMSELASKYKVAIVGGDITHSEKLYITVAVIGQSSNQTIMQRKNAEVGDILAVSGNFGLSELGLRVFTEGIQNVPSSLMEKLAEAHLQPRPQLELGQSLVKNGVKCALDCSDGFLADAGHILEESGVGLLLNISDMPMDNEALDFFGRTVTLNAALSGGEDYQLIFTAEPALFARIKALLPEKVHAVGSVVAEHPGRIKDMQGNFIEKKGYKHFG